MKQYFENLPLIISIFTFLLLRSSYFPSSLMISALPTINGDTASSTLTTINTIASEKNSTALVVSEPSVKTKQKGYGFLDDGRGARPVETTKIVGNWYRRNNDKEEQKTMNENDQQQHQVSWKDSGRRGTNRHIIPSLLTVTVVVLWWSPILVQFLKLEDPNSLIMIRLLSYCIYLLECHLCSTRKYLSNRFSPSEWNDYVKQLTSTQAEPKIVWRGECYHYQTTVQTRRQGIYKTTRTTSRTKIVTHIASKTFEVKNWNDGTLLNTVEQAIQMGGTKNGNSSERLTSFSDSRYTADCTFLMTTLSKLFVFTNPGILERYFLEETLFKEQERQRDRYFDFTRKIYIPNFRHKILVVRTGLSDVAFASQLWFWIASLMGMTVPFRIWFSRHCQLAELTVTKEINE